MKNITLNIEESVLLEANNVSKQLGISLCEYINEAIAFRNSKHRNREQLKAQIAYEAMLLRDDSMEVYREFDKLDDGLSKIEYEEPE